MSTVGKKITCKAAILKAFKQPLEIETIVVEPPGREEVRVKMMAVGLCHSDMAVLDGFMPVQKLPCILGHEGAGIVESIGEGVKTVKPGEKVLTLCLPQCRKCSMCKDNRTNACLDPGRTEKKDYDFFRCLGYDGTPRFFLNDEIVYHFAGCSAFSEYTVIPENSCVKIDDKAPLDKVCLCACGIPTGYGAAVNSADLHRGDSVAVWGVGGVGLATVVGCKDKGAGKIIGIAASTSKEQIARKMGCTDFLASRNVSEPIPKLVKEMTNGGVDFAFATVGDVNTMEDAILSTKPGGTVVIIGVPDASTYVKFSPAFLIPSRKIRGSALGDYKVLDEIPSLVTQYLKGKLPLDEFITNQFKLEEINDAISLMRSSKGLRSVILMHPQNENVKKVTCCR